MAAEPLAAAGPGRAQPLRRRMGNIALQVALLAGSFFMVMPFLWMLSTSLKLPKDIFKYPPLWIPSEFAWSNYRDTLTALPFDRFYLNSAIVSVSSTLIQVLAAALAAFAFARLRFRGATPCSCCTWPR